MWNKPSYGFEGFHRPCRTAWQIEDQSFAAHAAHAAAQCGKCRLLDSLTAHSFRDAIEQSITHGHSGLWCDIARGNPGAAGGHDESNFSRQPDQQILDLDRIVRNNFASRDGKLKSFEEFGNRGP
jgi:hypothetical protein